MKQTPRKKCWSAFSEMIRAMYADQDGMITCYTCGATGRWRGDSFQAGHFNRGRGNAILFSELEVRPQCMTCNMWKEGEQYKFGERLKKEIGEEKFAEVQAMVKKTVQYTTKDYEAMEKSFKERTKVIIEAKGLCIKPCK